MLKHRCVASESITLATVTIVTLQQTYRARFLAQKLAKCSLKSMWMTPQVPRELARCPSLAWMSLGGNAACAAAPPPRSQIRTVAMGSMAVGKPLGSGASGDVFAATLASHQELLFPQHQLLCSGRVPKGLTGHALVA